MVLLAFVIGFGIKTPLFPFHTWLPPAHVNAPGPVSAILAGVLLKMGTYGLVRIPMQMMPETFAPRRWPLGGRGGDLDPLGRDRRASAQGNLKRRIAYTSVNHMGYTVLGIAVAGLALGSRGGARLALTGAVVEMIAHGLITGSLFLIAGAFWQRTRGLRAGPLRRPGRHRAAADGGAASLAAFASFGLPGLAGFVAELHIFLGAFGVYPWLAAIGLIGILITAALFLGCCGRSSSASCRRARPGFPDLRPDRARHPRRAAGAGGADRGLAGVAAGPHRRAAPLPRRRRAEMPVGDVAPEIARPAHARSPCCWLRCSLPQRRHGLLCRLCAGRPRRGGRSARWRSAGPQRLTFSGTFALDGATGWARLMILGATALCVLLSPALVRRRPAARRVLRDAAVLGARRHGAWRGRRT